MDSDALEATLGGQPTPLQVLVDIEGPDSLFQQDVLDYFCYAQLAAQVLLHSCECVARLCHISLRRLDLLAAGACISPHCTAVTCPCDQILFQKHCFMLSRVKQEMARGVRQAWILQIQPC